MQKPKKFFLSKQVTLCKSDSELSRKCNIVISAKSIIVQKYLYVESTASKFSMDTSAISDSDSTLLLLVWLKLLLMNWLTKTEENTTQLSITSLNVLNAKLIIKLSRLC